MNDLKNIKSSINVFDIEFDSVTIVTILTKHTGEEIKKVMSDFEKTPEFINDSYDCDRFFSFVEKQGLNVTQIPDKRKLLFFDRSKQI